MNRIPILETKRLLLDEVGSHPRDVENNWRYVMDPAVNDMLNGSGHIHATSLEDAQIRHEKSWEKVASGLIVPWGIRLKDNPEELIGLILYRKMEKEGEWGRIFWMAKHMQGKGYMTEAIEVTQDYMFSMHGMTVLKVSNFVGNEASRRLKLKTGCRYLGVFEMEKKLPNATHEERWELTADMWAACKACRPGLDSP